MILWTRQVPQVWEEIQHTGIYTVKKEYIQLKNDTISDFYINLYQWYTKAARKHLAIEAELEYPIWLSVSEEMMLQPTKDTVIFKLEVPDQEVIICNMNAWGFRVNYWYVPVDAEDEKRHNDELKRMGIADEADLVLTDKGNFYPALRKKIVDSWDRVFTLEAEKEIDRVATIWKIKKEWVKEVRSYDK